MTDLSDKLGDCLVLRPSSTTLLRVGAVVGGSGRRSDLSVDEVHVTILPDTHNHSDDTTHPRNEIKESVGLQTFYIRNVVFYTLFFLTSFESKPQGMVGGRKVCFRANSIR